MKKIIVNSLLDSNRKQMFDILANLNLQFISSNKEGATKTYPINLLSIFPPNQIEPIFDLKDLEIPFENVTNLTSLGSFFNLLEISIINNAELPIDTKITIYYDTSPGAKLMENV
jgi:hypothetical protein